MCALWCSTVNHAHRLSLSMAITNYQTYSTAWNRSEGKQRFIVTTRRIRRPKSSSTSTGLFSVTSSTLKRCSLSIRGKITYTFHSGVHSHSTDDEALEQGTNVPPNASYIIPPVVSKPCRKVRNHSFFMEIGQDLTPPTQREWALIALE